MFWAFINRRSILLSMLFTSAWQPMPKSHVARRRCDQTASVQTTDASRLIHLSAFLESPCFEHYNSIASGSGLSWNTKPKPADSICHCSRVIATSPPQTFSAELDRFQKEKWSALPVHSCCPVSAQTDCPCRVTYPLWTGFNGWEIGVLKRAEVCSITILYVLSAHLAPFTCITCGKWMNKSVWVWVCATVRVRERAQQYRCLFSLQYPNCVTPRW